MAKYGVLSVCLLAFIPIYCLYSLPGHCYLMQDDLQKAYSAYQQALYLLPNPKVRRSYTSLGATTDSVNCRKIPSCGMVSASSMIDMGPLTTQRRRSHLFYAWTKVGPLS